ncbi:MAG: class I SAM-dependent methyltransferase [Phycisphaerales bacterium]
MRRRRPSPGRRPRGRRSDTKAFFGRIGGEWSSLRRDLFGEAFSLEALLGLIDPALVVADLGCGTGEASERLAPLVSKVIAIDRERAMLDAARKRLRAFTNIEFREGEFARLPLRDGEVDAGVVMLVLHHIEQPRAAIAEAGRAIKPRGLLLVVDMVAHDRAEWRHTMGHMHLGFSESDVRGWDGSGGLALVRHRRLTPDTETKGPGLFAALLRKA